MTTKSRGFYWEDFEVGQTLVTPKRTITSTDIVNFACLSGDFNEAHELGIREDDTVRRADCARAARLRDHGRAPVRKRRERRALLALLQVDKWRMLAPVKHGDTLHMESTVLEKKESSKQDRGVVKFRRRFMKHDGTAVQEMETTLLYRRRASNAGT